MDLRKTELLQARELGMMWCLACSDWKSNRRTGSWRAGEDGNLRRLRKSEVLLAGFVCRSFTASHGAVSMVCRGCSSEAAVFPLQLPRLPSAQYLLGTRCGVGLKGCSLLVCCLQNTNTCDKDPLSHLCSRHLP